MKIIRGTKVKVNHTPQEAGLLIVPDSSGVLTGYFTPELRARLEELGNNNPMLKDSIIFTFLELLGSAKGRRFLVSGMTVDSRDSGWGDETTLDVTIRLIG